MKFKKSFLFISVLFCVSYLGTMEPDQPLDQKELDRQLFVYGKKHDQKKLCFLLGQGADVNAKCPYRTMSELNNENTSPYKKSYPYSTFPEEPTLIFGMTVLHILLLNGYNYQAKLLLERCKNINDDNLLEALYYAVKYANVTCVKLLIDHNNNNNKKAETGCEIWLLNRVKCLISVICGNRMEIAKIILESIAKLEKSCNFQLLSALFKSTITFKDFNNAIHIAIDKNNPKCFEYLIKLKKKIYDCSDDIDTKQYYSSLLCYIVSNKTATTKCLKYLINLLIDLGVNINEKTTDGDTPIYCALDIANPECLRYLIMKKVDTTQRDHCSCMCSLAYAACNSSIECMEILLKAGISVDTKNHYQKMTPLNALMSFNSISSNKKIKHLRFLLEQGANPYLEDCYCRLPLYYSLTKDDNIECAYWLLFRERNAKKFKKKLNLSIKATPKIKDEIEKIKKAYKEDSSNFEEKDEFELLKLIIYRVFKSENFKSDIDVKTFLLFYCAAKYSDYENIYWLLKKLELNNENVFKKGFDLAKTKEMKFLIRLYYLYLKKKDNNEDNDNDKNYKHWFNIIVLSHGSIDDSILKDILFETSHSLSNLITKQ